MPACGQDDLTHRAFGESGVPSRRRRDAEQIGFRIDGLVGDGKLDVDDVLVAGKHQPRRTAAAKLAILTTLFGHIGLFDGLDRPPVEVQSLENKSARLHPRWPRAKLDGELVRCTRVGQSHTIK